MPIRAVLRRAPWQVAARLWHPEGPAIPDLVGPLRLDVLVVRDFLRFYLEEADLAARDFDRFVDEARNHRFWDLIYGWYCMYLPEATRHPDVFRERFAAQVRRSIQLWHEVARGFDPRHPIEIKVAARILPTATGKTLAAKYGLGDGSHRVACFMQLGHQTVPAGSFRYRWFRARRPYDGTWVLTSRRALSAAEYFRYLSEVYRAREPCTSRDELLRHIRVSAPSRLDEVCSVLRADGFWEG